MELAVLGLSFLIFLLLGVPVAFAIGLSSICTILYEGLPVAVLFQQMMSGMNIFSFLAIPFFEKGLRSAAASNRRGVKMAATSRHPFSRHSIMKCSMLRSRTPFL